MCNYIQTVYKGQCVLYEQLPFIYRLKLYAPFIDGENETALKDRIDWIYEGLFSTHINVCCVYMNSYEKGVCGGGLPPIYCFCQIGFQIE
jgi:hypothetical protein